MADIDEGGQEGSGELHHRNVMGGESGGVKNKVFKQSSDTFRTPRAGRRKM